MKQSLFQTFAMPLVLLLVTAIGLIAGFVADGWWDRVAIAALAVPLMVTLRAIFRPPSSRTKRKQ